MYTHFKLAEGWEQGSLGASAATAMGLLPLQDVPGWSEGLQGEETVSTLLSSADTFAETPPLVPSRTPKLSILVLGGAHRYLVGCASLCPDKNLLANAGELGLLPCSGRYRMHIPQRN